MKSSKRNLFKLDFLIIKLTNQCNTFRKFGFRKNAFRKFGFRKCISKKCKNAFRKYSFKKKNLFIQKYTFFRNAFFAKCL